MDCVWVTFVSHVEGYSWILPVIYLPNGKVFMDCGRHLLPTCDGFHGLNLKCSSTLMGIGQVTFCRFHGMVCQS